MSKFIIITGFLNLFLFYAAQVHSQSIQDFLVNEHACPDGAEQDYPHICGDGSGNYVAAWEDSRSGYLNSDIFAQIYTTDGIPQGVNFKVNDDPGNATQHDPCLATGSQLNFVIAWYDTRENSNGDIYAQRYSADGVAVGSNFKVCDDTTGAVKSKPAIACDTTGNFIVVWCDSRNGFEDIYAQRYLFEGVAIGSNFKVNPENGDDEDYWPHCACGIDGSFIVTWVEICGVWDYNIVAQRYAPDGAPVGSIFQVNTDIPDAHHLVPSVIIDASGGFKITWYDSRNSTWDIYIQCFQNDGTPVGDNILIGDNPPGSDQWHSCITGDQAGNFVICWDDDRDDYADVYARQYTSDCTPIGNSFKVNTDSTNLYQFYPCIASDESGNFMIAWTDVRNGWNGDIYGQAYSANGSPVDDNFILNDDFSSENQQFPAMAVAGDGTMIYCWTDEREYNSVIYAQRFLASGAPLGENFRVVEDSLYDTYTTECYVAADEEGNFVIAWTDFRNGYCFDIYAQRFAADGSALGSNFLVSIAGGCMHYSPIVSYKDNGNFLIVWTDSNDGGEVFSKNDAPKDDYPDIWAQLYLCDGTPVGDNFMVNEDPDDTYQTDPALAVDANGNFIIAWQDDRNGSYQIYLQRFQYDGTPIGTNFPVEDSMFVTDQMYPSVSMDGEGNFTIAWLDYRNGNSDIYCRRFLNDGSPIGESFQVNADSLASIQTWPCVSIQNDGKFVVSWTSGEYGNHNVFAQRFWSDGTPDSLNFMIPNTAEHDQAFQNISLRDDFIYSVWQDNRGGQNGFDIWANVLPWDLSVGIGNESFSTIQADAFGLSQNYPNPFKTSTLISLTLDKAGTVQLNIFDLTGRLIRSKNFECQEPGLQTLEITADDLPGGIYLYRIIAGGNISVARKMVVLK
jgi:hypothetical protein